MDSAVEQPFTFSPGVSLQVNAHGQQEIDLFWMGLSALDSAEQCGWLQDRYGVSWQIVPDNVVSSWRDRGPISGCSGWASSSSATSSGHTGVLVPPGTAIEGLREGSGTLQQR